jgi:hypothetical protein
LQQPEGQERLNDLVDIAIQSSSKTIPIKHPDGSVTYEQIIDDDTMWTKTLSVYSNKFSRMVFALKEWERMGKKALQNMSPERAAIMMKDVEEIGISYRRAIDAKSSESMRDDNNSQSTYLDKIARNKVEKVYTTKDGRKSSGFMDFVMGKDKERDLEND